MLPARDGRERLSERTLAGPNYGGVITRGSGSGASRSSISKDSHGCQHSHRYRTPVDVSSITFPICHVLPHISQPPIVSATNRHSPTRPLRHSTCSGNSPRVRICASSASTHRGSLTSRDRNRTTVSHAGSPVAFRIQRCTVGGLSFAVARKRISSLTESTQLRRTIDLLVASRGHRNVFSYLSSNRHDNSARRSAPHASSASLR